MQPNAIQNPTINERLTKWAGIRGQGNSAPNLAPEVMPVVIVDDISRTGKGTAVPTVRQWWSRSTLTAVNFNTHRITQLQNPPIGIQRIRALTICCSNTPSFPILIGLFSQATVSGAPVDDRQRCYIDGRLSGGPSFSHSVLDQVGAPDPLIFQFAERNQGGAVRRVDFANPVCIAPNAAEGKRNVLIVAATVTGVTMEVTFEGEEEPWIG